MQATSFSGLACATSLQDLHRASARVSQLTLMLLLRSKTLLLDSPELFDPSSHSLAPTPSQNQKQYSKKFYCHDPHTRRLPS
jgi:hypothetical protein